MNDSLWLYNQIDAAFQHLAIQVLIMALAVLFLFGIAIIIGEVIFLVWLTARAFVRFVLRLPGALKKLLTHNCEIPGCKGRHVSHI